MRFFLTPLVILLLLLFLGCTTTEETDNATDGPTATDNATDGPTAVAGESTSGRLSNEQVLRLVEGDPDAEIGFLAARLICDRVGEPVEELATYTGDSEWTISFSCGIVNHQEVGTYNAETYQFISLTEEQPPQRGELIEKYIDGCASTGEMSRASCICVVDKLVQEYGSEEELIRAVIIGQEDITPLIGANADSFRECVE